jgi:hypothetical protein
VLRNFPICVGSRSTTALYVTGIRFVVKGILCYDAVIVVVDAAGLVPRVAGGPLYKS